MSPIKNNIKAKREKLGLSQWALADLVGVTQTTVSIVENGYIRPKTETQASFATALNCEVSDIWRQ